MRSTLRLPRPLGILLALVLALAPLYALPAPPDSRAAALAALQDAAATRRVEGVLWVARHGAMADAELLHARLRDEHPLVRKLAEQALWALWSRSGDGETDRLLERGTGAMQEGRLTEAIAIFTGIIRRRPQFAEGWNKRATAYFLAGEYRRSIADCEEVFRRNPKHFGALAGNAQNWLQLESTPRALEYLKKALAVNPNLEGVEAQIRELEALERGKRAARAARRPA